MFVKDLSKLGRDLSRVILLDNCSVSGFLQPRNLLLCTSWFYNEKDTELLQIAELLKMIANSETADVRSQIALYSKRGKLNSMKVSANLRARHVSRPSYLGPNMYSKNQ
jgi:TFIIF-interacting CTD phosphatase-like protein